MLPLKYKEPNVPLFILAARRCCVFFAIPKSGKTTYKQIVTEAVPLLVGDLSSVGGCSCSAKCLLVLTFCFFRSAVKIKKTSLTPPLRLTLWSECGSSVCQCSRDPEISVLLFLCVCCQEACVYLLQHYDWRLDPPSQDLEYKWLPVSRPTNPPTVSFSRLDQTRSDKSDTS